MDEPESRTISRTLADFVVTLDLGAVDEAVRHRARILLLDTIGVALASSSLEFGRIASSALAQVERGESPVIGLAERLSVRDAALVTGMLIHGIDFDDTSIYGRIHPSSSCAPGTLVLGGHLRVSGRCALAAYVAGLESSIRIGAVAKGGFQRRGFHPTGVIAAFSGTFVAGKLLDLDADQLAMAQGIAYSAAAGNQEFTTEMAWTKRFHPGWGAASGITAATLAKGGFTGPWLPYEGRFGLYRLYLGEVENGYDYGLATEGLGQRWLIHEMSVKPMPACYFNIPLVDAAARVARENGLRAEDVAELRVLVPDAAVNTICEPQAAKRQPVDGYTAQFSAYFAAAVAFLHGGFTLADIAPDRLSDPDILALAARVTYEVDPHTSFPKHYGGAVTVRTRDGRMFHAREDIDRGSPLNPLSEADIIGKFRRNAELAVSSSRAERVLDMVLRLDELDDVSRLTALLAGDAAVTTRRSAVEGVGT